MDTQTESPDLPVVLAVDDHPQNLQLIATVLKRLPIRVELAENGSLALARAQAEPQPQLILLDVMMPDMDGHQVLAALRADPRTADIPVIFVTALDSPHDEESGLSEGAADYITKPIKPSILRARVSIQLAIKQAWNELRAQTQQLEATVARRLQEKLQAEMRLQLALESTGLGIWEVDPENGRCEWSRGLCDLLGLSGSPEQLSAWAQLAHPDEQAIVSSLASLQIDSDQVFTRELRLRHTRGEWIWVELRGRRLATASHAGREIVLGTITDIGQRKAHEEAQRLMSAVFTGVNDGIYITDTQGRILLVNAALCRMTGFTSGELQGEHAENLHCGNDSPSCLRLIGEGLHSGGLWQGEIALRRKDGDRVTGWLSLSSIHDQDGQAIQHVGIVCDLSERKAAAERIEFLQGHDPLTGLPNRRLFADRLEHALHAARRNSRPILVVLLNLDRFRTLNEAFGMAAGDTVLIEITQRLKRSIRDEDTLGRRSGKEFCLLVTDIEREEDAIPLIQRLLADISQPVQVGDEQVTLTACAGIALAPRDGESVDELLQACDAALARAKAAQPGTISFYSPEIEARARRCATIESALRSALSNDELSLFYQPVVSLDSGQMIGAEALLRWQHPRLGWIEPGEFIPIAEETGMIEQIGNWVLHSACAQMRKWQDGGLGALNIAINLSAEQFRQADLEGVVRRALKDTGIAPHRVELELTETAFMADAERVIEQCRKIRALGVKLSIDDFGSGYSSLAYLSRFPIDRLKIDRIFIRDIVENPVNAAIVSSAIVMGHSLSLSVLAEGVETEAQAAFLRGRHCDAIQGYLFARPMPISEFETFALSRKRLELDSNAPGEEQTLLLLDDEPSILNALTRILRREGYRILTATTPHAAFEKLAAHQVQVIVSDQRMPEMSGTDFFARVRQMYPDTLRLLLTGYTDLEAVTSAINVGAVHRFLTKPWEDEELREEIRKAFMNAKLQHAASAASNEGARP